MENVLICKRDVARVVATCALVLTVSGCEVFKKSDEVQTTVNKQVVGLQAGVFFDRYGYPKTRAEQLDLGTVYSWVSPQTRDVASGVLNPDDRYCTLRVTADRSGRIISADVLFDNPGKLSTSRCGDIFRAK